MNASRLKNLMPRMREAGPYLLIELLLPGGTLLALLLWLARGRIRSDFSGARTPAAPASAAERVVALPRPRLCEGCAA